MKVQFHKWMDLCKLLLIFIALTLFFYGMIVVIAEKIEPHHRFETPKGRAIKVNQMENGSSIETLADVKNRLLFFYWIGE